MEEKNKKLGKGLSSLFSGKSFSKDKSKNFINLLNTELKIGISKIKPNPKQPRKNFKAEELKGLANSISQKGIIQPILLKKIPNEDEYQIVAGERRWRAAQIVGLDEVPAIVKDFSESDIIEIALIENIQRENLNPIEEAAAFSSLAEKFNYNQEQLSKKIGKSRSYIANMLRLLELPKEVADLLINEKLTIGHARTLIGLENANELSKIIVNKKLSVRQTENLVSTYKNKRTKNKILKYDPNIKDLENELFQKIGLKTKVHFSDKTTSGSITVYYSNLEQLDDIMKRLKK